MFWRTIHNKTVTAVPVEALVPIFEQATRGSRRRYVSLVYVVVGTPVVFRGSSTQHGVYIYPREPTFPLLLAHYSSGVVTNRGILVTRFKSNFQRVVLVHVGMYPYNTSSYRGSHGTIGHDEERLLVTIIAGLVPSYHEVSY